MSKNINHGYRIKTKFHQIHRQYIDYVDMFIDNIWIILTHSLRYIVCESSTIWFSYLN